MKSGQYNKKQGFKRLAFHVYVINVFTKRSLLIDVVDFKTS